MSELKPGYYPAKIYDYAIAATRTKGDPQIVITMQILTDGSDQRLQWRQGVSNEVGLRITLETLARLGLENGEDIHLLAKGRESGLLDMDETYEVQIANERDDKNPDIVRPKIKGIYLMGGDGVQNKVDENQAAGLLGAYNLATSFNQIKSKLPPRVKKDQDSPPPGWA